MEYTNKDRLKTAASNIIQLSLNITKGSRKLGIAIISSIFSGTKQMASN